MSSVQSRMNREVAERAVGALWGQACGDAFGMPNSYLPVPSWRLDMEAGPQHSPYHAGYVPGQVTDDTEQAQALSVAFRRSEDRLDSRLVAEELAKWFDGVGGADSLAVGPSTKRALSAIQQGVPVEEAGRFGVTNGAPMRVSVVGVWAALNQMSFTQLLDDVEASCIPTHNTSVAISGAAAIAAAVWSGVRGASWADSVRLAIRASHEGERRGSWVYGPSIGARILTAIRLVGEAGSEVEVAELLSDVIGMGEATPETVPAAFAAVHYAQCNPAVAIRIAGNARGDTDTVAAIAGAMAGAHAGAEPIPELWRATVRDANKLDVDGWLADLER